MSRGGWHTWREGEVLCHARQRPPRFDLAVEARFPAVSRRLLASQIRQDLWRLLRGQRGFAPAVRVAREGAGLRVTAGGAVLVQPFPRRAAEARIAALLASPHHRQRWIAQAGRRS